jgi:hypothetical protein
MGKTNILKVLPAVALTCMLVACGGDEEDGSIVACFTADKTVNFAIATSNLPSGQVGVNRSTFGPMTYRGQAVMGQTSFYPDNFTEINYWTVTSSGVAFTAYVSSDGNSRSGTLFYPQDMSSGQTVTDASNNRYTLVGFETINLAGKTFSNVCHIKVINTQATNEIWYAPGYGDIKEIHSNGVINQYNGDL